MELAATAEQILSAVRTAGGLDATLATGAFGDLTPETVEAVMMEAARFAGEVLAPLNRTGDRLGVTLDRGRVTTAPGFADAYRRWAAAGWNAIGAPAEWGGQAMPIVVQIAVQELWNAANPSFAVGPMLTAGAIEALAAHGDVALKTRFIPRLVTGEWTATMNLTSRRRAPTSGRSRPAPSAQPTARTGCSGKRFSSPTAITISPRTSFTWCSPACLTRRPAPRAFRCSPCRRCSTPGARNDVVATGIEDKLGLHGAPTCTMVYGEAGSGAVGWRVGEENKGLAAMFTMMNMARLSVGVQGVGVAAGATAAALAYARQRRQGYAPGVAANTMSAIIDHPDVRRMLLSMEALTAASRAICHATAHAIDMSRAALPGEREAWADRAALLTPIAKAFPTDAAIDVANLGIQVHGGAGYIEETGAAQALRDARIFAIYEGTNGIQAIDLATRKLLLGNGKTMGDVVSDIQRAADGVAAINHPAYGQTAERLAAAAKHLAAATSYLARAHRENRAGDVLAVATPYLRLAALGIGGASSRTWRWRPAMARTRGGGWRGHLPRHSSGIRPTSLRSLPAAAPCSGKPPPRCRAADPAPAAPADGVYKTRALSPESSGNEARVTTLLIEDPIFLRHLVPTTHPERPDRLLAIGRALGQDKFKGLIRKTSRPADLAVLASTHPESHVDKIRKAMPDMGVVQIETDTWVSPDSFTVALHAIGAACMAVDEVIGGRAANAFSAARPPGHHARPAYAMGFCIFNNVAIAARYAQKTHGAERVAIVDWDVHHGNGTQEIFWSDRQRPLLLHPPDAALPRNRPSLRDWRRQHLQLPPRAQRRQRGVPGRVQPADHPGARRVPPRPDPGLVRIRRALSRPAGQHQSDRG
jgi:alkylation response protein AidB-like acyl-CoA dehydrogenase